MGKQSRLREERAGNRRVGAGLLAHTTDDGPGKTFHAPERTHERNAYCANCLHYEDGEKATKEYLRCRERDINLIMGKLMAHGKSMKAAAIETKARIDGQDAMLLPPRAGICTIGASGTDFVTPVTFCDKWTGRERLEGRINPEIEEVRDLMGEPLDANGQPVRRAPPADAGPAPTMFCSHDVPVGTCGVCNPASTSP